MKGDVMPDFSALWIEDFPIPPHAIMALAALAIGALQFAMAKGTATHKAFGYLWIALMAGVAITGLFIHTLQVWWILSPIHLLIPVTLISLLAGIWSARKGNITAHKATMISLFLTALIVTGGFTLIPGRAMHAVFFGTG